MKKTIEPKQQDAYFAAQAQADRDRHAAIDSTRSVPRPKPAKAKVIKSTVLDAEDVRTVRWLLDAIAWVPSEKRVAVDKLAKKVGY